MVARRKRDCGLRFMGNALMVMHMSDRRWHEAGGGRADWPTWVHDSRSILCRRGNFVLRYRLDKGTFETVTVMKSEEVGGSSGWLGLAPGDTVIRTLNRDTRQIYALQLENR